jgi:hypothetical protein
MYPKPEVSKEAAFAKKLQMPRAPRKIRTYVVCAICHEVGGTLVLVDRHRVHRICARRAASALLSRARKA